MRVVHVTDTYAPVLGGKELHVRDLAHEQAALGHEVVVLTATEEEPVDHRASGEPAVPAPGGAGTVRVVRLPDTRSPLARGLLAGADVVHAHLSVVSPFAWSAVRAAAAAGVPVLAMVHVVLPAAGVVRAAWRGAVAAVGPAVTWGTVSRVAAQALRTVVPGPVHVLPNGIDPGAWAPSGPSSVAPRPVTVVASGRLAPRKRVLALVAVLDEVRRLVGPDVPLRAVVVGEGPLRPLVEWQVRGRGMARWVELPGRLTRPQLRELYAQADVFVAPARVESFGLAALEARCAGLPVVAHAVAGVSDFVTDGVEGRLAADDAGLAAAVADLVTDDVQRARIAAHNRDVPTALGWAGVLDRCFALYAVAGTTARRAPVRARRVPARRSPARAVRPAGTV
ncbi:glycosyltransferase family 4 protein [Kineosporia sp. A_224]|uniref:glycosyltransferase family 4 protein n=1 Tax=Kineosporia sp. A_224 TaxID=1962180 RepID=UPI000B4B0132|nr:glycosyltransferase family 4 protein [Kineosporia sp. A_224]